MPDLNVDDDQLLDEDQPEGDEPESDADGDGGEPNADADTGLDEKTKKRIADLQSAADKATARANKAEKALQSASGKGTALGSNDPAQAALMQELREASLDAIYGEFTVLKDYGIDRSLIEGSTRAQMRESATSVVALIKSVETKARNKTLADHGIKAEPAGATRQKPVDYNSMSEEDFEKLLDSI